MAEMMEVIEEYLISRGGVAKAPLAYVIRKTILFQTYGDIPAYATPDDKMITRMLHLPPDKTDSFQIKMLSQPEHIQQSTR